MGSLSRLELNHEIVVNKDDPVDIVPWSGWVDNGNIEIQEDLSNGLSVSQCFSTVAPCLRR
jgi:hypothetical protein